MITIKFRGKTIDEEKWVYGFYVHLLEPIKQKETDLIYTGFAETDVNDFFPDYYKIDPKSVGQYIGLIDKKENLIYEGDILRINDDESGVIEVRFVRGVFAFLWNGDLDEELPINAPTYEWAEIIGNIHDNPELLKGDAQ